MMGFDWGKVLHDLCCKEPLELDPFFFPSLDFHFAMQRGEDPEGSRAFSTQMILSAIRA